MCREVAEGTASRPPCPAGSGLPRSSAQHAGRAGLALSATRPYTRDCTAAFLTGPEGLGYFRWCKLRGRAGPIHSAAAGHHEGSFTRVHHVVVQHHTHYTRTQKFFKTPTASVDKLYHLQSNSSALNSHHPCTPTSIQAKPCLASFTAPSSPLPHISTAARPAEA